MLDRLFAALVNGPNLNCRPHASRQRVDLVQLSKLHDVSPENVLRDLLGPDREARVVAKTAPPKRKRNGKGGRFRETTESPVQTAHPSNGDGPHPSDDGQGSDPQQPAAPDLTPEERAAIAAWDDQEAVLRKLRVIVDDARTYEQDTGVHVVSIGFPLLMLPASAVKGGGNLSRRIIAPVAFVPVEVTVKQGAARSLEIRCRGEGADLVTPNTALLAWLGKQTGRDIPELDSDEKGDAPWQEIRSLTELVADLAGVPKPDFLAPPPPPAPKPTAVGDSAAQAPAPAESAASDAPPAHLTLLSAPKADDETSGAILCAAILGLFPMANQGLLRDTQEMSGIESFDGPIAGFLRHDAMLDAPAPPSPSAEPAPTPPPAPAVRRKREFAEERLVTAADPSQSRAVRLARQRQGLVIHGPPGTGKSQTITNIIGDHLFRGQRVLVVCDKRTALDVVIDRLDRLGLRQLCALVYDPQRDRRELYKGIRQQLDDLPEFKTRARAEKEVEKLDAELQQLHDQLTQYATALSQKDDRFDLSFHDMVGQWLAASSADGWGIDATMREAVTLEDLASHEQTIAEILDRGIEARWATNPWRQAAGISLAEFLSRPMAQVRAAVAGCVEAATETDRSAHDLIPPFAPQLPLGAQAQARTQLAIDLREALSRVDPAVAAALAKRFVGSAPRTDSPDFVGSASRTNPSTQEKSARSVDPTVALPSQPKSVRNADPTETSAAQAKLTEAEPFLKTLSAAPLDPELSAKLTQPLPADSHIAAQLDLAKKFSDEYRLWSGRYRAAQSAAPLADSKIILHWLSRDAHALSGAKSALADLDPIASRIKSGRLDRSLAMQYERQPFDLTQTIRWLGLLNAYVETAAKWYAFLKPRPKREAMPIAQFFGLALTPATGAQLRDFLIGLRSRQELRAELQNEQPIPADARDEDLLAAYEAHRTIVDSVTAGRTADSGDLVAPELVLPLMQAQADAARPVFAKYAIDLNQADADRLVAFLSELQARLRCTQVLREFSIPIGDGIPDDPRIVKAMADAKLTLAFLAKTSNTPELAVLGQAIWRTLQNSQASTALLQGLDQSPARVSAILKLEKRLADTRLFSLTFLATIDGRLRNNSQETDQMEALAQHVDRLESVLRVANGLQNLGQSLRPSTEALAGASADAPAGLAVLRRAALTKAINQRLQADPMLQAIDAQRMNRCMERYRQLEADKREAVRDATLHRWVSRQKDRLLANTGSRLNSLGAELRRRLTIQGEKAMRLRQVVALGRKIDDGDPLFDICPVWMASPETVAQLFPREPIFDVAIFDEASQCRLEEALPVLTRAKRVVIAGDPQQLPPTRFFESAVAESTDEEIESDQQLFESRQGEVEDLLAAALNIEIEQSYLDVHYRSHNSALIQFSNRYFYNSRLQPIPMHPSKLADSQAILLDRTDGVYHKRSNEKEAERVCEIVAALLKRPDPPSIGIACFNLPQRDLIVETLEEMAGDDPAFAKRLAAARSRQGSGSSEGLFVKNLENVQGDERDHIIISTTYGPDANGKFYRRFGPVGMAGGGRRLNVLVTRARKQVHVVTSIPPESYRSLPPIPAGQLPTGAWLLFAYLNYAEHLSAPPVAADPQSPDQNAKAPAPQAHVDVSPTKSPSAFARALADDLLSRHQIGSDVYWGNEGFAIDLALRHPDHPDEVTIGVLCDAARFGMAEDLVEWDIFRTGVLADQGWTLHRIWTPHFFRDPEGAAKVVTEQVEAFVEEEAKEPEGPRRTAKRA
jgi:hypothetical protein